MINILLFSFSVFWILVATLTLTPRTTLAQSKNGLCLTEPEVTDVNAMGQTAAQRLQAIRDWLDGLVPGSPGYVPPPGSPQPGFLKGIRMVQISRSQIWTAIRRTRLKRFQRSRSEQYQPKGFINYTSEGKAKSFSVTESSRRPGSTNSGRLWYFAYCAAANSVYGSEP
jgi:hypothetical protein